MRGMTKNTAEFTWLHVFCFVCKNRGSEKEKLTIHNQKRPVSRSFSIQLPHRRKREELNWHYDAIGIGRTGRFRRAECCHSKFSSWNTRDSNPDLDTRDAESLPLCYSIHFVRSVSYKYWILHVKFSANSQSALWNLTGAASERHSARPLEGGCGSQVPKFPGCRSDLEWVSVEVFQHSVLCSSICICTWALWIKHWKATKLHRVHVLLQECVCVCVCMCVCVCACVCVFECVCEYLCVVFMAHANHLVFSFYSLKTFMLKRVWFSWNLDFSIVLRFQNNGGPLSVVP